MLMARCAVHGGSIMSIRCSASSVEFKDTLTGTHFYYHCQNWLRGPQSGVSEQKATRLVAPTHKHTCVHTQTCMYTLRTHNIQKLSSHAIISMPTHKQSLPLMHLHTTTNTCYISPTREPHTFQGHISHHMFLNGHPVQSTSPW